MCQDNGFIVHHYDVRKVPLQENTVHINTYRCPGAQFWHTINSHDINICGGPDAHFYTLNYGT